MKIHEYQAEELLREAGVRHGARKDRRVARPRPRRPRRHQTRRRPIAVVKAQIHAGGRGKGRVEKLTQAHPQEAAGNQRRQTARQ